MSRATDASSTAQSVRNGDGSWPTQFERPAPKWPEPPERWVPDHAGRAQLVCVRAHGAPMVIRSFATAAEALEADAALPAGPCGRGCQRLHYRVWTTEGRLHVECGVHDPAPVPRPLALALAQAYPPRPHTNGNGHRPPRPHRRKETAVTRNPEEAAVTEQPTDDEALEIIRAERRAGRLLARLGLNRRAALGWREVADLRAAGADAEAVAAAEAVAQALTDAALAAIDTEADS